MGTNVRESYNCRQAGCTGDVVDRFKESVHSLYRMSKKHMRNGTPLSRHFIREWREYRGLTLEQVAELIDRTHASVQRIETRKQAVTQPVLDALARVLGATRGDLLDRPPPEIGTQKKPVFAQ